MACHWLTWCICNVVRRWWIVNYGLNNAMRFWNQMKLAVTLAFIFYFFVFLKGNLPAIGRFRNSWLVVIVRLIWWIWSKTCALSNLQCILMWRQLMSKCSSNGGKQSRIKNVEALGCVFYQVNMLILCRLLVIQLDGKFTNECSECTRKFLFYVYYPVCNGGLRSPSMVHDIIFQIYVRDGMQCI